MTEHNNRPFLTASGGNKLPGLPPAAVMDDPDPALSRIRAYTVPVMAAGLDLIPVRAAKHARVTARRAELEFDLINRRNQIAARIGPMLSLLQKEASDGWE